MSGTYPSILRPDSVVLRGYAPTLVSTPHSLKRQTRSRGIHRWYLKLRYKASTRDEWAPHIAFLDEQMGQSERFSVVIPGLELPRGAVSGATLVNGAQGSGARSIALKGLPVSVAGVFKAHDLITFASHLKVYEITRDAASDAGGLAAVYLNCPLMSALANNEAVTWQNVAMKVALINDTAEREYRGGMVCPGFEVELGEDPY